MNSRYSLSLNYIIYFFIVLVFIVIQSVLLKHFVFFAPLLFLLPVIYFSNTRSFYKGIIISFIIGYLYHLHSSTNEYVSNFFPILVFIFSRYMSSLFVLSKKRTKFLFISSSSFFYFLILAIWHLFYTNVNLLNLLLNGLISSIILGTIGVFIFDLFNYIDIKTGIKESETIE